MARAAARIYGCDLNGSLSSEKSLILEDADKTLPNHSVSSCVSVQRTDKPVSHRHSKRLMVVIQF